MATNYPGAVDSLTNPAASDPMNSPSHAGQHTNANDAIEAIETELGTDPAGGSATVKARFDVIEANDWVTAARIAADAVGTSEIAANAVGASELADNAVDTAAIADGAVTAAKFATQIGNLLTANQASIETDTTGWTGSGCTIGRASGAATHGSYCLGMTAVTGTSIAYTGYTTVAPGDVMTACASFLAGTTARAVAVQIIWWTSGGSYISAATSPAAQDNASTWTALQVTGTAPATAAKCNVYVSVTSPAESEWHGVDSVGLWKGAGGTWSLPGVPITGLSEQASNGAVHLSGTGTPESVVTAAPGSTWLQTDSTVDVKGWIRWVKATGTGSTGWVAGPEADTGWRDITATVEAAYLAIETTFKLYVRRIGATVEWIYADDDRAPGYVAGSASGVKVIIDVVPAGLRTVSFNTNIYTDGFAQFFDSNAALTGEILTNYSTAKLYAFGLSAGKRRRARFSHGTDPAVWLSSLPGSAV